MARQHGKIQTLEMLLATLILFAVNAVIWALALWQGGKWETAAIWVAISSAGPLILIKLWKFVDAIL